METTTAIDEKAVKAVEAVLGDPAFPEFNEKTWKIRTNLIIASVISIGLVLGGLNIEQGSTVLGLRFTGLTDEIIRLWLFLITAYLAFHFLWNSVDEFLTWRLRITGTRVAFITTGMFASEHGDYPKDPRASTLYYWWTQESKGIENLLRRVAMLQETLQERKESLAAMPLTGNMAEATNNNVVQVGTAVNQLQQAVRDIDTKIHSGRVEVSLRRFDGWFALSARSQNLRWLVVDFLFPILLSLLALTLLWLSP